MILEPVSVLVERDGVPEGKPNVVGWNSDGEEFAKIVREAQPDTIVEVGSWVGQSAIRFAELRPRSLIICVETGLGSFEHMGESMDRPLPRKWNRLQILEQFLVNVHASGCAERIYPVWQTSKVASRLVGTLPMKPDFIFLDGDHDWNGPYSDLRAWWPILANDGWMVGDDFAQTWPAVVGEVQRFAWEEGLFLRIEGPYWILRKK